MKLLLIEDDRETAAYLIKGLSESGYTVDHAGDGPDGLFLATSGSYEAIILDCPPSLSLLSVNAIVAADGILIPVVPEPMIAEALETLLTAIARVRARMTPRGKIVGILLSAMDPERKHTREIAERLRATHRDKIFQTEIRYSATLSDAPGAGKTIAAFAPRSASADAYRVITLEASRLASSARPRPARLRAPQAIGFMCQLSRAGSAMLQPSW